MPGVSVLASDRDYLSVTVGGTASDFHRLALRTPVMYSFALGYHNVDKTASLFAETGVPGGIRTHDPLLRRQPLYPAELQGLAISPI